MNTEVWAVVGTSIATLLFFVLPALAYVYYVLEVWIDDNESYRGVMTVVERNHPRR
jgi:hypothetical protein